MSESEKNPRAKAIHAQWKAMTEWVSGDLSRLTDDELSQPIAPGRNHGVWILGHLIESEDDLSKYLGTEPMIFPEYEEKFGQGSKPMPPNVYDIPLLREQWREVLVKNDRMISSFEDEHWDEPHVLLDPSDPDAQSKDYFKTKGRCIEIWILHQMYHCGQLSVLSPKKQA